MTFSIKREILTVLEEPCVTRPVMTTRQKGRKRDKKKTKIKHKTTEDNTFLSNDYQIGGSFCTNNMLNFGPGFSNCGVQQIRRGCITLT